jgi:hypothetical protein
MKRAIAWLAGGAVIAAAGAAVLASSPDSWDKFRAQLVQACTAKAKMTKAKVSVAPEGTASYGVALLRSEETAQQKSQSVVCIARKTPEGIVDVEVTPPATEWIAIE